jgi:hypothetical protein
MALAGPGASEQSQQCAPWPLCLLWHCREPPSSAEVIPARGALLAQNAVQPQPEREDSVESVPTNPGAVSVLATKAVSRLSGVTGYRSVVNQQLADFDVICDPVCVDAFWHF